MARAPWYCWREDVADVLDVPMTPVAYRAVDRAIGSGARSVEGLLKRKFYPEIATRRFDWPPRDSSSAWHLWLYEHEVISVDTLTAGGQVIPGSALDLRPEGGPPFSEIQVLIDSGYALASGSTWQDAISILGLYGYRADEVAGGALAAAVSSTSATSIDVTDGSVVGVGAILRIDTERVNVTERTWIDTTFNVGGAGLTADVADRALTVSGGTFFAGERLLLGTERVLVTDVAGSVLSVLRAVDGTVLAVHAASQDIYASRRLTVERGYLGTTAATHLIAAPVFVHDVPALVRELATAETVAELEQGKSGWARVIGSGETERETAGKGLLQLRKAAGAVYRRGPRKLAV